MSALMVMIWVLLLAGIPALVRTVDGNFCGDRLGKLAAAAVSALLLFAVLLCLCAVDAPIPRFPLASLGQDGNGVRAIMILALIYWIALYAAWVAAARLRKLLRSA